MPSLPPRAVSSIQFLQRQAASLLLYQSVLSGDVGCAFLELLQALQHPELDGLKCLETYASLFKALATEGQSWQEYLLNRILRDDNPFTQQAQLGVLQNPALIAAAQHDLQALQSLYNCSGDQLSQWVQAATGLTVAPVVWHQKATDNADQALIEVRVLAALRELDNWGDAVESLVSHYQQFGTGLFVEYQAFRWQSGQLVGISHPDPVQLAELVGYELQQDTLVKNTEFLLAGYPALHVLLYGSRGSGKSSLVKGLLNEYGVRGLRLVEVTKSELNHLPQIVEQLRGVPQKFIIFVDDLSFEEDDDAFKALKVVLEGNITARPQNVVVYATSNRRHLVREFFDDRPRPKDAEEIQSWDTVQEKLSFSDRFGLTLTFEPADQKTYLAIVHHLAVHAGIKLVPEELEYRALQWATRHNGRSGRTARQFIDFLRGELAFL
ncbi:MAG: ATP-binding protein [Kastovskya adunca ATA6-11-RM4]|jgi:hypothetical protein|nr:ATP-binding protein [Kastovskya adunca ATA6-11-RM4]